MNLKLYIKQTDTFNTSGTQIYYHGANPSTLNLYTGQLPSARRWPNYGSYIDVSEDAGDLYKLKLTWTSERDSTGGVVPGTIQQKKSASGTLKFEGEAYQYLKRWLIDDVSAPLNSVDVKIEHVGCGTYYGYTIKCTDLQWCEGGICTFDVTLKQKDEILNCIRSTAIADNWLHRFEDGSGITVKHPRFNYCNEIRPNGSLVVQWFNMAVTTMMLLTLLIPLIGIYNTVIVPTVNSILFILRKIENALNSIPGVNVSFDIRDYLKPMDPADIKDAIAQMFLEAAGCGRMHPAPLIRSYIDNVCEKCGVKVDAESAPIFYAEKMLVHASDDSLLWKENPHYNACYLNAPVKKGIRRYRNLGIGILLGYSELNMDDYYLQDNRPIHTLDTFLEELKLLYNAEWKVKTVVKNGIEEPYLFFQRKDFFVENKGGYVFDFSNVVFRNMVEDPNGVLLRVPAMAGFEQADDKLQVDIWFINTKDIVLLTQDDFIFLHSGYAWWVDKQTIWRFSYKPEEKRYFLAQQDVGGYYAHMLGRLPISIAGGVWNTQGYYDSYYSKAKAAADDFISAYSAAQLVDKEASHPFIVEASTDCAECRGLGQVQQDCDSCPNGVELVSCGSCHGSGQISRNPGQHIIVPQDKLKDGSPIQIVNPDVSINAHHRDVCAQVMNLIIEALHLQKTEEAQSGVAKAIDQERLYKFISNISNHVFDKLITDTLRDIIAYRNAGAIAGTVHPVEYPFRVLKPTQFRIKTSADLLNEYATGKQAGIPVFIRRRMALDFVDKQYSGDALMKKKAQLITQLDSLSVLSIDEITAMHGAGVLNDTELQYSRKLPAAIDALIREKGEYWFLNTPNDVVELCLVQA